MVTGVGGPAGMAVIQSLRRAPERLKLTGVDMDPLAVGFRLLPKHELVPAASASNFVSRMLSVAKKHGIDVVIPTVDEEVEVLASHANLFKESGISLPIPDHRSVSIARDKYAISSVDNVGVPGPKPVF